MQPPKAVIYRSFELDIAHKTPFSPPEHPCNRLHGHRYVITLELSGEIDPKLGWVQDFNEIKAVFKPLFDQLDHHYLNVVDGLENPTAENVAVWIWQKMKPLLPKLNAVKVAETPNAGAIYYGP